jgi:hypothetical protein
MTVKERDMRGEERHRRKWGKISEERRQRRYTYVCV